MITCPKCHGKKTVIDFTIGMTNMQNVPAYVSVPCPVCKGAGYLDEPVHEGKFITAHGAVKIKNPEDFHEHVLPDSIIMHLLKKLCKK